MVTVVPKERGGKLPLSTGIFIVLLMIILLAPPIVSGASPRSTTGGTTYLAAALRHVVLPPGAERVPAVASPLRGTLTTPPGVGIYPHDPLHVDAFYEDKLSGGVVFSYLERHLSPLATLTRAADAASNLPPSVAALFIEVPKPSSSGKFQVAKVIYSLARGDLARGEKGSKLRVDVWAEGRPAHRADDMAARTGKVVVMRSVTLDLSIHAPLESSQERKGVGP